MSLIIRRPWFPMARVMREFGDVINNEGARGMWGASQSVEAPVNVYETDEEVVVECELPGVPMDKIELTITGGSITLKADRPGEGNVPGENYFVRERWRGECGRTVTVPGTVDSAGANASYKDGVLTIRIPKKEEAKPRRIDVNVI